MGSSESKMSTPVEPELTKKNDRLSHVFDPRSPSAGIARTPIQIADPMSKTFAAVKSECAVGFTDPRSPSVGIARTPVREVMRATVGSLARRLGVFFHNEAEGKVPPKRFSDAVVEEEEEAALKDEELASTKPLLTPQVPRNFGSLVEHANLLATPVQSPLETVGDASPYVLVEEPQLEVEIGLEEAEEARESPLHKRLSMSLITCHEGAVASQIFAEVHHDSASAPVPAVEVEAEPIASGVDHPYALPSITVEPESPTEPAPAADGPEAPASPTRPEETVQPPAEKPVEEPPVVLAPAAAEPPSVPSPEPAKLQSGFPCLTIDAKSPSQVVFKPQWLGKGFGASGLRARAGQRHGGKKGSSPRTVKNGSNENKGRSSKLKQKGTEGRSPLQILKETNSPRERPQMKLKVSTPDRQRLGQLDRRVLTVALDKENR